MLKAYGYSSWSDKKVIQNTPLFFVPGGFVYYSGTLRSAGLLGTYWSSMAYFSTTDAYYLYFYSSYYVLPSDNLKRDDGTSVRCIARDATDSIARGTTDSVSIRTVALSANDSSYGSVSQTSVTAEKGSSISSSDNTITIGSTTVTATAKTIERDPTQPATSAVQWYVFDSWTNNCGSSLTANCTIVANFSDPNVPGRAEEEPEPPAPYLSAASAYTATEDTGTDSEDTSEENVSSGNAEPLGVQNISTSTSSSDKGDTGKILLIVFIALILILAAAIFVYFWIKRKEKEEAED